MKPGTKLTPNNIAKLKGKTVLVSTDCHTFELLRLFHPSGKVELLYDSFVETTWIPSYSLSAPGASVEENLLRMLKEHQLQDQSYVVEVLEG